MGNGFLKLKCSKYSGFQIGDDIILSLTNVIDEKKVALSTTAPLSFKIYREENKKALESDNCVEFGTVILTRSVGQSFFIGNDIQVVVSHVLDYGSATIGIKAPRSINIRRIPEFIVKKEIASRKRNKSNINGNQKVLSKGLCA